MLAVRVGLGAQRPEGQGLMWLELVAVDGVVVDL